MYSWCMKVRGNPWVNCLGGSDSQADEEGHHMPLTLDEKATDVASLLVIQIV